MTSRCEISTSTLWTRPHHHGHHLHLGHVRPPRDFFEHIRLLGSVMQVEQVEQQKGPNSSQERATTPAKTYIIILCGFPSTFLQSSLAREFYSCAAPVLTQTSFPKVRQVGISANFLGDGGSFRLVNLHTN